MSVLEELGRACPSRARPGEPADSVGGVVPEVVVTPRDTLEVAGALRVAAERGLHVVPRGAGTKLEWGNSPRYAELIVDLSGMDEVVEHESDDLVARVEAGATLTHLSEVTGGKGQRFPVDEVVAGSTVGGVVATGLSGPARYLHGAVRDLVLGATMVRADGVIVRAGSKVVKNVAGYDLTKLFTGSFGTLGILTELVLKLKPVPIARRFVVASCAGPGDLGPPLAVSLGSQSAPTAIEVERAHLDGPLQLCVLIEGRQHPTEERAAELATLLGTSDVRTSAPPGWGTLPGPVTLKLTAVLSAVPELVEVASSLARGHGLDGTISGSAGSGVLFMGISEDVPPEDFAELTTGLRRACHGFGGHATVLQAPSSLKAAVDVWGPVPGMDLMRRVKDHFDPARRLSPGRFVGGI